MAERQSLVRGRMQVMVPCRGAALQCGRRPLLKADAEACMRFLPFAGMIRIRFQGIFRTCSAGRCTTSVSSGSLGVSAMADSQSVDGRERQVPMRYRAGLPQERT